MYPYRARGQRDQPATPAGPMKSRQLRTVEQMAVAEHSLPVRPPPRCGTGKLEPSHVLSWPLGPGHVPCIEPQGDHKEVVLHVIRGDTISCLALAAMCTQSKSLFSKRTYHRPVFCLDHWLRHGDKNNGRKEPYYCRYCRCLIRSTESVLREAGESLVVGKRGVTCNDCVKPICFGDCQVFR